MTYLKVNGHVANDKNGTLFFNDGTYIKVSREIFDEVMNALLGKDKKIQVTETLTLTY